jgi:hypothetical protein
MSSTFKKSMVGAPLKYCGKTPHTVRKGGLGGMGGTGGLIEGSPGTGQVTVQGALETQEQIISSHHVAEMEAILITSLGKPA